MSSEINKIKMAEELFSEGYIKTYIDCNNPNMPPKYYMSNGTETKLIDEDIYFYLTNLKGD